ncbi:phosphate-starvation-inducible PsiE family protein [Haloarchaeobius sp. HME9146]|uniref:phosphate-starvation-inducible PsiE family protein n=1 Tax=Haloarchaeobius sp. HME9146 TaxID=2978732 RepID=UPI0021C122A4|nr:phosphate-starvation-inducible PsiE family protein [Haloarchaeobius sp. HME9146]MCT9094634.1 phosphate-starvation-inducible PsiE family protein [Haloarchaeobius sp. HME9146]
MATDLPRPPERPRFTLDRGVELTEVVMQAIEFAAAVVMVFLFAVGVLDLGMQIAGAVGNGDITDPLVVVGFIDTALLLFIIVEVYQTVLAYAQKSKTTEIVRIVVYTGVIAMVRKIIVFRTDVYASKTEALLTAAAYTVVLLGLGVLLYIERTAGDKEAGSTAEAEASD